MRKFTPLWSYLKSTQSLVAAMSSEGHSENWRGVPISEMYGSQCPWGAPEWALVSPGHSHAVLYHIPSSGNLGDRPPKPQIGQDRWDNDHVRMPFSSHSLYPVEDSNHETHLKKRWGMIEVALWKPIRNSKELACAILSYNTKFKSVWKFRSLFKLFDEYLEEEESQYFFDVTLPEIAKLALALPKLVQSPIPLLRQHKNQSVSLSQQQISSLLANAFFCTFPRRNTAKRNSEYAQYPFINFNRLYETGPSDDVLEKLKSICHYFRRVCTKAPVGVATFTRRSVPPRQCPAWHACDAPLAALPLHVDPDTTIEDADGLLQVDFANKYLGGGVLGHGCVQEEIRFVICPELMISMLFTESLRNNEALLMIGCERYSKYSGYGHSFHWTGDFVDETPYDSSQRRRVAVLAIDALPYSSVRSEYRREAIERELNKAWIGFSYGVDPSSPSLNYPGVGSGNWGCGAFGGSPQLKSLVQMMACVVAKRPLAYYAFRDNQIRDDVIAVYNLLARYNVTVGQLYKYIMLFSETDVRYSELHAFIHQKLRDESQSAPAPGDAHDKLERMDTSVSSETSKLETTTMLTEDEESPDLFSQGEFEEQITEVKFHKPGPGAATKETQPKRSRLLEEMEKLDEQSGRLNLVSNSSPKTTAITDENTVDKSKTTQLGFFGLGNQEATTSKSEVQPKRSRLLEEIDKLDESNYSPRIGNLITDENSVTKPETNCQEAATSKRAEVHTKRSKLFDEMEKLDEQSGRLNLVCNPSPLRDNLSNNANSSMDTSDSQHSVATTEFKKKISRKITDYFGKKSL